MREILVKKETASVCYKSYVSSHKKCKKTTEISKVTCAYCINKLLRDKSLELILVEKEIESKEITLAITFADLFLIRKALDEFTPSDEERQRRVDLLTWMHTDWR